MPHPRVTMAIHADAARHAGCSSHRAVHHIRPLWTRGLSLYQADAAGVVEADPFLHPMWVHARSRFRHADDPACYALYSLRHGGRADLGVRPGPDAGADHTLVVVREFRRVPLDATRLALAVFTARPSRSARVIATLAHWVERAMSLYQPTYLLLARSLEQPAVTVLLTGVREVRALQAGHPSPFSLDSVLPELMDSLEAGPDRYVHCPDGTMSFAAVSPSAV